MNKLLLPLCGLSLLCLASCGTKNNKNDTTGASGSITIGGGGSDDNNTTTDIADVDETIGSHNYAKNDISRAYKDLLKGNYTVTFYFSYQNTTYERYFKFDADFSTNDADFSTNSSEVVVDRNNGYAVTDFDKDGITYFGPSGRSVVRQYMKSDNGWEYYDDEQDLYTYVKKFADIIEPSTLTKTTWIYGSGQRYFQNVGKGPYLYIQNDSILFDGILSKSFSPYVSKLDGDIYKVMFTNIENTVIEIDPLMESTAVQA